VISRRFSVDGMVSQFIDMSRNVNLVGGRVQQGWGSALFPPDSLQNIDGVYCEIIS